MNFTAYEFKYACDAGLILTGVDEGKPEWLGSIEKWNKYKALIYAHEQFN